MIERIGKGIWYYKNKKKRVLPPVTPIQTPYRPLREYLYNIMTEGALQDHHACDLVQLTPQRKPIVKSSNQAS